MRLENYKIMEIQEFHLRILKTMKILESQHENRENHGNPINQTQNCDKYENHGILIENKKQKKQQSFNRESQKL